MPLSVLQSGTEIQLIGCLPYKFAPRQYCCNFIPPAFTYGLPATGIYSNKIDSFFM
jgi:hypothetical protein